MATELTLLLSEDGADPERVEMLTGHLRRELGQTDVERVSPLVVGPVPEGARAVELAAVGGLFIALGKSAGSLAQVVGVIRSWLARTPGQVRTVRLEIAGDVLELSQASAAEQDRLVELFVDRHASSEGSSWPGVAKP